VNNFADKRLQQFRTRWRRWLGNKTATARPYWTTLLRDNWACWPPGVLRAHGIKYDRRNLRWNVVTPESVKKIFQQAIDVADFEELRALDGIYLEEKSLRHRR